MNVSPLLIRVLRWHISVRAIVARLFFVGAFSATLLALFWVEENWRAARAWTACQRELTARGERWIARLSSRRSFLLSAISPARLCSPVSGITPPIRALGWRFFRALVRRFLGPLVECHASIQHAA